MDRKLFNLIKWLDGKKAPPYILELRTTNRCNLDCISCWHRIHEPEKVGEWDYEDELSDAKLLQIVDEAVSLGIQRIEISGGGEPMFRHDLTMTMMERIKQGRIEGCLTTNATLFRPGDFEGLVEYGWDELLISLDGPDAPTHDFLRRAEGSFRTITEGLRELREIKEAAGVELPRVKLVPVLSNRNYDRMKDFFPLAAEIGASYIRFQALYQLRDEQRSLALSEDQNREMGEHIHRAMEASASCGVGTNADTFLEEDFSQESTDIYKKEIETVAGEGLLAAPCYYPWFYIGVRPNGSVTPCIPFNEFESIDNIQDKKLLEVWDGPMYNDFRDRLLRQQFHSCCETCCGGIVIDNQHTRNELMGFQAIEHFAFFHLADMVRQSTALEEENKQLKREIEDLKGPA